MPPTTSGPPILFLLCTHSDREDEKSVPLQCLINSRVNNDNEPLLCDVDMIWQCIVDGCYVCTISTCPQPLVALLSFFFCAHIPIERMKRASLYSASSIVG